MKKILIITVIILFILLAAAVSNPSKEEFVNWGAEQIQSNAESEIERIFGGALAEPVLEMQTDVRDNIFYSIFTLKKSDREIKYLGIFNKFFQLSN
ncbi:MAG: hypothetical protein ACQESS_06615 [Bacillota bacterium]